VLCALQFSRPMLCTWANTCISMGSILCNVCETLNALVLWPLGMLLQRVRLKHSAPVASESGYAGCTGDARACQRSPETCASVSKLSTPCLQRQTRAGEAMTEQPARVRACIWNHSQAATRCEDDSQSTRSTHAALCELPKASKIVHFLLLPLCHAMKQRNAT